MSKIQQITSYITHLDSLQKDKDDDSALEYHKQALADREEVLGSDHELTLSSIYSIALSYQKQGNFQQSLKFFIQANEGYEKCLGSFDEKTLKAYKGVEEVEAEMTMIENEANNKKKKNNTNNHNDTDNDSNGSGSSGDNINNKNGRSNNQQNGNSHTNTNRPLSRRSIGASISPMNIMTNSIMSSSSSMKHEAGDDVPDLGVVYNNKGHSFNAKASRPVLHPSRSSGVD